MIYQDIDRIALEYALRLPRPMNKQTQAAKTATNIGTGLGTTTAGERNTLLPAYQGILNNPGYSDADKSAMRLSTLGGVGATYGSARDAMMNNVARTRNTAGDTAGLDDLARAQAAQTATSEAGLESKFADTALSERDNALKGLSGIYGVDQDTMAKLLGIGTQKSGGFSISGGIPGVIEAGYKT